MSFVKYLISKQFRNQILIAIILLGVGFYTLATWLELTTNHDQKIQVPDLSKLSLDEVRTTLTELNLRFEVLDSASFNPNFPKQSVISQSPEKDSFVKENRNIYLTLNPSKYGMVRIHDFYGKTKNEVIAQLKSNGFVVGKTFYVYDIGENVVRKLQHKGKIIKEGDKLERQSVIDLIVGNGGRR